MGMRSCHDHPVIILEVFHHASIGKNNSFSGMVQWDAVLP
jgi:hypothetical protein